jgi:hypothetical protein
MKDAMFPRLIVGGNKHHDANLAPLGLLGDDGPDLGDVIRL